MAFETNSTCQRAAALGFRLAVDCLAATRLLATLPLMPAHFTMYSGWSEYRLADVFVHGTSNIDSFRDKYPGSIAFQYAEEARECCSDWDLLARIVRERGGEQPAASTLVIQVRAGDVIDNDEHSVLELLTFQMAYSTYCSSAFPRRPTQWWEWASGTARPTHAGWCEYVRPLGYYRDVLRSVPKAVERVELVSGSHWPLSDDGANHVFDANANTGLLRSYEKSWRYLQTLRSAFAELGYPTTMRLGRTPDEDIAYVSRARFFLPSGGGFSRLLTKLVHLNGGQIVCPTQTFMEFEGDDGEIECAS